MDNKEIWKDIKGYEGIYRISNMGRVKSLGREIKKSNWTCTVSERILKLKTDNLGYKQISLQGVGIPKYIRIHKLVASHFLQNYNPNIDTHHIDGNKKNNNVDNLICITRAVNIQHAYRTGLNSKKLNADKVIEIRKLLSKGVHREFIASIFNIDKSMVSYIKNGTSWKHLQ